MIVREKEFIEIRKRDDFTMHHVILDKYLVIT